MLLPKHAEQIYVTVDFKYLYVRKLDNTLKSKESVIKRNLDKF